MRSQASDVPLKQGIGPATPHVSTLRGIGKIKQVLYAVFTSEVGLSTFIAWLSIIIIAFLLSSRYLTTVNLGTSQISQRDIYAEKTVQVEDKEATERLRYEAHQRVAPIYRQDEQIEKDIRDRLLVTLDDVATIRTDNSLSGTEKRIRLSKRLSQTAPPPPNVVEALLTVPSWEFFYSQTLYTLDKMMKQGISNEDFATDPELIVQHALSPKTGFSPQQKEAAVYLISQKLRPTLLIDEKLTEDAKDMAGQKIKPVLETYQKGDLIVKHGEKISPLAYAVLQKQGLVSNANRWLSVVAVVLLSVSLLSIVWGYLFRFEHSSFFKPAYASLLAAMMVFTVGGFSLLIDLRLGFPIEFYPIAMMSLMISIFTHPRIAMLTTMMILLLCGITLKIPLETLSVLVISSLVGIFVLARKPVPKDRNDVILAGLALGLAQGMVIWATSFIYDSASATGNLEPSLMLRFAEGVLCGFITSVFTLGFLPLVESLFKLVTPYTLLELANHDRPILKRMQIEAPGTFHHSLMVASLAESAAEAIGANPILTRVGALYHDIGKIKRPAFFIENQAYFGIENPHDKLTPRLSKMVITAHPRDGVEMGKHLGLPKVIMRFMPEHHGTMVAGYFYNKAVLEEGEDHVNKDQFRYPGPKPQSRETAVVMLADACESAVRALKSPTPQQVDERVDHIFHQRIEDEQFSDCPITFQEMHIIRETFLRVLRGIQHSRIEYQQNILEELGKKASLPVKNGHNGDYRAPETNINADMLKELEAQRLETAQEDTDIC